MLTDRLKLRHCLTLRLQWILKNARVIILDEATAYADPENEYLIQSAISKIVKGKTPVSYTHLS